jgi:ankyrin repeat protein
MIKQFLDAGGRVNVKNDMETGNTPLHCAVLTWDVEIVEMLLDAGVNVSATSKTGISVLDELIMSAIDDPRFCSEGYEQRILDVSTYSEDEAHGVIIKTL